MILTRVQIENYKQYQGSHDIEIPQDGIIGVIGENGTGKTTLFEAIEWCLYNPRTIGQNDVRPRGYTGHTTVSVHLETADRGNQYIVQRVLKRTPSATIFQIDEHGEPVPLVQGARQVTEHVAARLIGLSHSAFTATFFTRQKELHLFGGETPAKRREAIGRMLGLETIRHARTAIMTDRSAAMAEARAMRTQYEREADGRRFDEELEAAATTIAERTRELAIATEAMATVEASSEAAEREHGRVQERRDTDAALAQQVAHLEQERTARQQRQEQICADLATIAQREQERETFVPRAARADTLRHELERQEKERSRYERRMELERQVRDLGTRRGDTLRQVTTTVTSVVTTRPPDGWYWSRDDEASALAGLGRLLAVLDGLDLDGIERREQQVRACIDAAAALATAEQTLARYTVARHKVDAEERALLVNGEPRDRLPILDRKREELLAAQTTLAANRTTLESERDTSRILLRNLNERQFGDDCPTCGRPFSADDATVVIAAMRQRIDGFTAEIERIAASTRDVERQVADVDANRRATIEEQGKLEKVRSRIQASIGVLEEQQQRVAEARSACADALGALGLDSPPSAEEYRHIQLQAREVRTLGTTRTSIVGCQDMLVAIERDHGAATSELAALADVTFDLAAFRQLERECQEAGLARTAIAQIDREIARRSSVEAELGAVQQRLAAIGAELTRLDRERRELAYDGAELSAAQTALKEARSAVQAAHGRYHTARSGLREAELLHAQVVRERERLQQLATRADARQVEADELDLMAREFMEFERFAVARKVPILNEYTSALVEAITNGKYQRVEFDQDFGIVVYDGDDGEGGYPVETFSGGERDAIVLAARLAMSQMIGRQAVNPPGFLVLDEVFGSLDTERRSLLLGLLGTLSNTFDEIRQVFIISHVDDVRTSPVLDEVWRVEETAEGASQITVLGAGVEIDAP